MKNAINSPFLRNIILRNPDDQMLDCYPKNVPLFKNNFQLEIKKPVLIISGENGTGKSTLLEAIAINCGFNSAGGNKNHIYKESPDTKILEKLVTLTWSLKVTSGFFMRAESFYNFATYLDHMSSEQNIGDLPFAPYGGKSLNQQSHGEAFLSLFNNKFNSRGIYILDEPEAALSPMRQLSLLAIIHDMSQTGNIQIIISTHSPILMSYPQAQMMYIQGGKLESVNYMDTEHYKITKQFINAPQQFHKGLFSD